MIAALSGVVVHPWMSRDADEIAWLAWAVRDKRDRLDQAMRSAAVALAGQEAGEPTAPQPAALRRALTLTADALDKLAAALAEHGTRMARDRAELASLPPHRVARIAALRHRIRISTDALSEADVQCRRLLEQAVREVPSASGIAATAGETGGWPAVLGIPAGNRNGPGATDDPDATDDPEHGGGRRSGLGSVRRVSRPDRSPREALRVLPTPALVRSLAASPELRVRLAEDVPKLGEERAVDLTNLAEAAGVDSRVCHTAAEVVRRRSVGLPGLASVGDDDGGAVRAAEIDAVVQAFAQLGDDAAHRMALLWPRLIGGLDGAPVFARSIANHTLLRAELEAARRSEAELEARAVARRVADEPFVVRRLRSAASAAYARREWLTSLVSLRVDEPLIVRDDLRTRIRLYLRLLTERVQWPGEARPRARTLLTFEPSGRGRVVEVMGRLGAGTENLAVIVPGTTAFARLVDIVTGSGS